VQLLPTPEIPGVPTEILRPGESWADKSAYDVTAEKLAGLFNKNFETYAAGASAGVIAAAPVRLLGDELPLGYRARLIAQSYRQRRHPHPGAHRDSLKSRHTV
jgi:hypothetical protein